MINNSSFSSKNCDLSVLLIAFSFGRQNENLEPYGISCLTAAFKNSPFNNPQDKIDSLTIDLNSMTSQEDITACIITKIRETKCNIIAFSNFIWADRYIKNALPIIKKEFKNHAILMGGPMVSGTEQELKFLYPEVDIFVKSFGEAVFENLRSILASKLTAVELLPSFSSLNSPYLTGEIQLKQSMSVRMETRRGCVFNCSYCRHRNANCKVYQIGQKDRIIQELALFKEKGISKINVLDPFFNDINNFDMTKAKGLSFLNTCRQLEIESQISVQIRPEMLKTEYIQTASQMKNVIFEIGIQSLDTNVYPHIRRGNQKTRNFVLEKLTEVQKHNINTEITLIYGLPNQTYESFAADVECLKNMGFTDIKAFPLQLYPSTEIIKTYSNFGLKAQNVEPFGIMQIYDNPYHDFKKMENLAENLH